VTHLLTRQQERRKHEREVAAKLAELNSRESSVTQILATQYAQACLVVERPNQAERDRIFLPVGCRITLGRAPNNEIMVDDKACPGNTLRFVHSGPLPTSNHWGQRMESRLMVTKFASQ
jgi:hypothetical protein